MQQLTNEFRRDTANLNIKRDSLATSLPGTSRFCAIAVQKSRITNSSSLTDLDLQPNIPHHQPVSRFPETRYQGMYQLRSLLSERGGYGRMMT